MVHQLTKFHVQRVDMVINPQWNLPFLGAKGLTSPKQMATGKGISNPFMASTMDHYHLSGGTKDDYSRSGMSTGNDDIKSFKFFNDSPLTGVNTPGSDKNRLKLYDLMYIIVNVADMIEC
ncbi:hypothetical protein Tco_1375843 [Tanacetum coccineum]